MGIFDRFFGKREGAGTALVANETPTNPVSLQLLFAGKLTLEASAVTRSLRAYHPRMASASCEIDAEAAKNGTPFGVLVWGRHVAELVGFDVPMPSEIVEKCVQGAHYGADLKAKARAHGSHVLLYYAGQESDPLRQYVALAAISGALSRFGAIVVMNESGRTSFPAEALAHGDEDMLEFLQSLPIPMLYSGFLKLGIEGVPGVWMRTFGNPVLGLPDLAYLAKGNGEGEATFMMFDTLLSYLRESGATIAPGHTMQVGEDTYVKARARHEHEYFLESEGELLVLEKISRSQINSSP